MSRIGVQEMIQLWLRYSAFQERQLSASTMQRDYGKITKRLLKMPDLTDEIAIRDWLSRNYSTETARRTLEQFSACCSWAVRSRFIKHNPFAGLSKDFRKATAGDRRAFTAEERDQIITAFQRDTFLEPCSPVAHSYYQGFIKFLFWTGCRLEEARALRWSDISRDLRQIRFQRAIPADTNLEGTTKTRKSRDFPCNDRLMRLLRAAGSPGGVDLVFPSPRGKAIDTHNLLNRGWGTVLNGLVKAGMVREYLPLKNTRHTFITLALESGIDAKDIAYLVGNKPEVIYKHYAAVRRNLVVPEF